MSFIEDYNSKIEEIKKIPDDQIKTPNDIPVGIYIQEAFDLKEWCQADKEELTAKGLDWKIVEDLPIRCGALREAESKWNQAKLSRAKAENIWKSETSGGYDLRNELVHHFRYAFRDDSSLILTVKDIAKRNTHSGMIQGLRDLYELGIKNRDLLKKIGFDFTILGQAANKAEELGAKYESSSWDREDYCESGKIRNQAFTYLKKAVDLIRKYGRYVFWRNAARLKGYRSNHLRKKKLKKTRQNTVTGPEPETGFEMVQIDS
jgi:hypothetical protein